MANEDQGDRRPAAPATGAASAEEELRRQSEWFRVTLSSIGDAVISTDADARVTFMNVVAEELTGWAGAEAVGRPLTEVFRIINEHSRREVDNPALRALREGTIVGLANHTLLIARDGTERPIDDSAAPMRDASGATIGAVLVFRDVTERKRAEETQARLAAIVASSEDAVISKSLDNVIRTWNGAAERLFGYSAAEAVGQPITLIIPPDRRDEERVIMERVLRGERIEHVETQRVTRDGRRLDISLTVSPVRDPEGTIIGIAKVGRDVTERNRSAAERERLVESLGLALAAGDLGTWDWDPATDRMTMSPRAAELYGVPAGGTYTREGMRARLHPEDRDRSRDLARQAVAERRDYDIEYRLDEPEDRPRWVSARGRGVYDADGKLVRMLGVVQDVTERKLAEAALRASERRHRFLSDLSLATQAVTDPDAVMSICALFLAEHLGVDRCAYAEVEDESVFVITGDHPRGVPSIVGRWPVEAFGAECARLMRANEPYIVHDVDADPRIGPDDRAAYRATTIAAVICVPLHKEGRFIAAMAVHQKVPRRWTADEIDLVCTVVDRCWEALERSRVTRSLAVSEARFRAIVEATPECVKLVAPDGTLLQMNRAGLGMIEGDESAFGQCVYNVIAPEYRAAYRAFNERVCRGERGTLEFDIIGLKGTRRHMETTAVPLPAPDNGFTQLAVTRDVTERTVAARAIAENRARLEYAVRVSGIGFWYCDLPFDVLEWDDRVKEHFWLPPDAVVTIETFYDRIHPDDREATREAIARSIRERSPYDIDYRTVDPAGGAIKWVRALGGTSYDAEGRPTRFDGVTVDVTARKLDEVRLTQTLAREQRQAELLKQVADAALTIHSTGSLDSVIGVIAGEARRILGARKVVTSLADRDESPLLKAVSAERDEPPEAPVPSPAIEAVSAEVRRTNRARRLTRDELESLAAPSAPPPAEAPDRPPALPRHGWLAAPFVSRGGRNLGLIQAFDKDEGAFSETEEAVLVQLAHIASIAIENARLNDQLRLQDRRKDEFLALLAHELRNPLAPIRNGIEVLNLVPADAPEALEAREMMDRQLTHMVRLVDDLLDVSRITRDKLELRRSRIALADVVGNAVEIARPLFDAAGHRLHLRLPPTPILLDADLTRLAQVFGNLLTNSAKYTERGGDVWLTAAREGGEVVVTVRDTGIGIPADAMPTIFDMFSQVDRTIERSTGGLGIGLALVKGLVESHGGSVASASPGPGLGSTFTVRLPVAADRPEAAGVRSAPPKQVARRRILIVDDNRDAALSMGIMLRQLGNDVRTAHDGLAAVAAAEEYRPQVILMDVGMPLLNGYDATRRIRLQPWGQPIVIVALTGWGQESDKQLSREAGCDGHLVKPVKLAELEVLLGGLLGDKSPS